MQAAVVLAVRYLFFTRYSWLAGTALVLLAPLALNSFPGLLANLFVMDLPAQVYHVSWMTMWCAVTVIETLRVTTMHAHLRFDDYRTAAQEFREAWNIEGSGDDKDWYRTGRGWLLALLGFGAATAVWHLVLDACISRTVEDPAPTWRQFLDEPSGRTVESLGWERAWAGWATTVVLVAVLNGIFILLRMRQQKRAAADSGHEGQPPWQQRWCRFLNECVGPGYFHEEASPNPGQPSRWRLASGHLRLLLYAAPFVAWYFINYITAFGDAPMPTENSPYSALFYGLLSLLLLLYLLPGIAFFWDRYRVPVTLLIAVVVLASYTFFDTDHYYELNPREPGEPAPANYAAPTLERVYDGWQLPRDKDGKRTLVVVDASGGGIQAAAWTAQVLTGLHECYGDVFTRSVGLISSVSGGSVGSMYYLAYRAEIDSRFDPSQARGPILTQDAIQQIRASARASALEATAWGISYPDTMRTFFPPAVARTVDRGWAIEQVWRQRLAVGPASSVDRARWRLTQLGEACVHRQLPIPVFNATLMESGQRLQISPVLGPPGLRTEESAAAVELLRAFPKAAPYVSTATRLSATFPYVSPAARSDDTSGSAISAYHIVDGAYVDNEGVVTSVDWINRLIVYYSQEDQLETRPLDRILLIRIQAFPKEVGAASVSAPPAASGWRSAVLGPLDAMMNVRSTSQTERGDLEIGLLTKATLASIDATRERFQSDLKTAQAVVDMLQQSEPPAAPPLDGTRGLSPSDLARQQSTADDELRLAEMQRDAVAERLEVVAELEVQSVLFDFHSPDGVLIPLSWKLTERQKQNIDQAWRSVVAGAHPHQPLGQLDQFFSRADRQP